MSKQINALITSANKNEICLLLKDKLMKNVMKKIMVKEAKLISRGRAIELLRIDLIFEEYDLDLIY